MIRWGKIHICYQADAMPLRSQMRSQINDTYEYTKAKVTRERLRLAWREDKRGECPSGSGPPTVPQPNG